MKVLMIGATGKVAGLVAPELTRRGAVVRAVVRDQAKAAVARDNGASETVIGDLHDFESLCKAATGVDAVFHIGPRMLPDEAAMGVAMVEAAKSAGVRKFVFSGVIHPSLSALTNHVAKLPVEEALYQSGMNFTVLQPTTFMQNLKSGWETVVKYGYFGLPFSVQALTSYVDYRDVAEVAALALTTDTLDYATVELCAPGMLNRIELAAIMSEALQRNVEARKIPFEEWAQASHTPDGPVREGLKRMFANYDKYGFPGGNALVLRAILGREPRSLREYVRQLASH